MKPLVIYHDSCADGFGAAFAAWLKLGDDAEYFPCQYGKRAEDFDPKLCANRNVYILDFSFPNMIMDSIIILAKSVTWLDHHKTAFEDWVGEFNKGDCMIEEKDGLRIVLDDNQSGAMLAWKHFHPGTEVPLFIRHIDDYDRWQFKIEGTKALNKYLWSRTPWSFSQWQIFCNAINSSDHVYFAEGEAILRAHEQNVASVVKGGARKCMIRVPHKDFPIVRDTMCLTGLAANCPPHLQSDVGHELAMQSGTFGLLWCIDKDLKCKCSLRSNGDYDVSAIAKVFGGGGHRNAAGFQVDIQVLLGWLK